MIRRIGMIALSILLYLIACWFRNLRDDTICKILMKTEAEKKWKQRRDYFLFSALYFLFCYLAALAFFWGFFGFFTIPKWEKAWFSKIIALGITTTLLLLSFVNEGRMRYTTKKEAQKDEKITLEELLSEREILVEKLAEENEKYNLYFNNGESSRHSREAVQIVRERREAIRHLCEIEQKIYMVEQKETSIDA